MSKAIENLEAAQKRAFTSMPSVGGFPHLAERLRRAGVTRTFWSLPACQSIFLTNLGRVVVQRTPLVLEPLAKLIETITILYVVNRGLLA